ncbi:pilus assembly protein PilY [Pseudomonas taiwanensis]|uniref:pilus assembly protein n=1 Tax=Pseudomonas taiwanensis TaxID=470150 RepID=UPI0015BA4831|nr:PilC/PilY family type IV pilus protein [Pseudomonas taiwanensis]NWL75504.1 pilus assembly protein PilY [Pseudomonas taiwanensis]
MKKYFNLALMGLLLAQGVAKADDVDLFVGTPASATEAPNVLIVLDNRAEWNTAFNNEMAALSSVISALPANKFRVGLMMYTETGNGNSNVDGGYVRAAIRLLTDSTKPTYQALVNSLDVGNDKSNGGKISLAFEEAYLYFSAGRPYAGNFKNKSDYTGSTFGSTQSKDVYALAGNALATRDAATYTSPIVTGCAKNYVIYISNGAAQDDHNSIDQSTEALAALGGRTTEIPITPSGSQNNMADEWARFMKKSSLGITTYTVDINKKTTGQGPGWTALLKSAANVSSGKYFDVTSTGSQIADALNAIFSEIQAVNSVFASVSLPVSVNTQGTYLNQVYVGMFRPDQDGFPRWAGNLKQYKLGVIANELKLQDADSKSAINASTGFITECARSFWTPNTTVGETYWTFRPQGACLLVPGSDVSDYPDGNIVEKGAQAYMLRNTTSRTIKTCDPTFSSCTALTDFATANTAISNSLLGAADATERTNLINWATGTDNMDEDGDTVFTEKRPSMHGDVVHSRPVAINYGTDVAPQVVVFYGGNDGLLRAINGNRTTSIGLSAAGQEIWSFMAPEFYANIKRIRDNTVTLKFPGHTTGSPTPQPKPYGFDGTVAAYVGTSSKWLYATMRRGGRALYAFDVSNASSPVLKWKKGCPNNLVAGTTANDTGCTSDFSGIGQTWSAPKIFKAAGYGSGNSPLLIMGGGYDPCEDSDPHSCTSSTKGNHVYVLDADSGTLLRKLDTDRAVVGDVTVIPDQVTGLAKYAYLADLGGSVYRIDIGTENTSNWDITKIASLGCNTANASCTSNRKFVFGPDVVLHNDEYILLLGSGDREKPLTTFTSASAVSNHFFMLKDRPEDEDWLDAESDTCGDDVICRDSLFAITTSSTPTDTQLAGKKGWYLALGSTEQVVTSAITVFGIVTFSTHMPAVPVSGQCSNLGVARVYNISYLNAEGLDGDRYEVISGGGLPPSPVAGMVTLDDGSTVPFVIGANPDSPLEGSPPIPPTSTIQPKARVYWNIEQ